ncbi:MAG: primosomal protein N' [Acidobacteriota bacterium]|nr:primosomal protein N' [Acidobacteriota bacterium]
MSKRRALAQVAVPLPLAGSLTYSVPAKLRADVAVGARVRVRVGKRKLTGVVVGFADHPPDGVSLRDIESLLDAGPLVDSALLDLARFVSEYYLAPLGEVLRSMVPSKLPPWGTLAVSLTRRGAFAAPRSDSEAAVVEALLTGGAQSVSTLAGETGVEREAIRELIERGWLKPEGQRRRAGGRFRAAVELPVGDLDAQFEICGRSKKGRTVVEYLAGLGRPATVREVAAACDCGQAVIRRLVKLGALRSFTQIERLDLERHMTTARPVEEFELTPEQQTSLAALEEVIEARQYGAFVLHGVTGSGKTEVFLRATQRVLEQGRGVLLLVPEISLVPALGAEARRRFGDRLAVMHSAMADSERCQEWERARSGEARVVLGPRSAVFAPIENLGLVVVDEEHDSAYKQEHVPRYNARDIAVVRARAAGAVVALASATPSFESRRNVETMKMTPLLLPRRVAGARMPEGILVDLRKEAMEDRQAGEIRFSQRLLREMDEALADREQIILLRNRRGYAPVLLCRACGEKLPCNECGLPRTLHRRDARLACHYCGSSRPVPHACPGCGDAALEPIGAATARIEERVRELFPDVPVDVLDRDAVRRIGGAAAVLERFGSGQTRILIGTQMVSKGHHFPQVGLAAVLSADSYLSFPDFRAVERTYALLTQLAGRAGRGSPASGRPGRVVIQTFYPEHYAIQAALAHDDQAFAEEEMRFRRVFHYPPYTRLTQLIFKGRDRASTWQRTEAFHRRLLAHALAAQTRFAGPAAAALERLKGEWRFQILIRHPSSGKLRRLVEDCLAEEGLGDLIVDVDPQDLF